MNKYREKSDHEINKAVAVSLGYTTEYENESVTVFRNNKGGMPLVVSATADSPDNFAPCSSWSDAGPIIAEYGISLLSDWNKVGVWGAVYQPWVYSENEDPLRAAMECYLLLINKDEDDDGN